LKWYKEGAARMPLDFLPDHIYDSVLKRPRSLLGLHFDLRSEVITYWQEGNPEYDVYMKRETPAGFCRLLVQIGPDDDPYIGESLQSPRFALPALGSARCKPLCADRGGPGVPVRHK
jgi:hypothetical protein